MRKAETTKQSIISKAAVLFNEKGIAGTSIEDVLRASKVAKGCLYGHFKSKEDLSYASVDYLFELIAQRQQDQLGKHDSPVAKLFAFVELNKNPLIPYITGGCPIINLATETDDTNPNIKKKTRKMITQTINLVEGIIKAGIFCGELSNRLDPKSFAISMVSSLEGANAISRIMNSNLPMHETIKSIKENLSRYILQK